MSHLLFAAGSIVYLALAPADISPDFLDQFHRRQTVNAVVRTIDGQQCIVNAPFIDDWTAEERTTISVHLHQIADSGQVVGAYCAGKLLGFAAVAGELIGSRKQYADLLELHVDADLRRHGIGRQLFALASSFARSLGAEALYLSTHSAIETQQFYAAQGCVAAQEPQAEHVAREPFDVQMELDLRT